MRKPLFNHLRHPILASRINQQISLFPTRFLDLMFFIVFQFCQKMLDLGTSLQNPVGTKMRPEIDNLFQNVKKLHECFRVARVFVRDLLFLKP